jgi:hypothetical protein
MGATVHVALIAIRPRLSARYTEFLAFYRGGHDSELLDPWIASFWIHNRE